MDTNDKRNQSGGFFGRVQDEFSVRSASAIVGFDFAETQPAAQNYIGVDDQLLVGWGGLGASKPLNVNVRMLGLDGLIHPIALQAPGAGTRALTQTPFPLMEGFLLSVGVIATNSFNAGDVKYASVGIVRNPGGVLSTYRELCAGYVTAALGIGWPEMPPIRSVDGTPLYARTTATPAAGADWSFTVPAGARWRAVSVSGLLTTAVAVANRDVTVVLDDGANVYAQIPAGFALAASLANQYTFADSVVQSPAFNSVSMAPLPSNLWLMTGHRIRALTANLQAADQWSNVNFLFGEVLEPL